ncbi:MAG: MarC family protein [Candidatus Kuenenia sp.]|nr:MarC family protein [Candidatus Kuenenia sp.]
MEHWTEYTRFLTALMVILDPFAAIPLFLSLTQGYSQPQKARVVLVTIITVALVLISSAISGESLLKTFGTSLASFRVGGGIVLFIMALAMLRAQTDKVKTSPTEEAAAENKAAIAVVPLAIPLLAGPGSISTVIIEMHRSSSAYHWVAVILCIIITCILLWIVLRLASPIGRALGPIGLNVLNRLFGLILTAIAIEIIANGLRELFPSLA